MLRIDLLPSYIRERRKVKPAMFLVLVILVIEIVALVALASSIKAQAGKIQKDLDENIEPDAQKAEQLTADAQAKTATVQPAIDRVKYYEDMGKLGDQFVELIDQVNEYIYDKVTVQNLTTDGSTLSFTAVTDSTESFGRFLLNFLRCPAVTNVQVSTNVGAGGGAGGGMPGGPPGMGPPGVGGPAGMGPGGPGMPPGMGPPGMPGGGGLPSDLAMGAPTAAAGGGAELITINVQCSVAKPVVVPTLGGAAAAAAGMGAMGGMGGMGMPGMGMPGMGGPPGMEGGPPGMEGGPPGMEGGPAGGGEGGEEGGLGKGGGGGEET